MDNSNTEQTVQNVVPPGYEAASNEEAREIKSTAEAMLKALHMFGGISWVTRFGPEKATTLLLGVATLLPLMIVHTIAKEGKADKMLDEYIDGLRKNAVNVFPALDRQKAEEEAELRAEDGSTGIDLTRLAPAGQA